MEPIKFIQCLNNSCKLKQLAKRVSKTAEENKLQDNFELSLDALKDKLIKIRDAYIEENPESFLTLDHFKSNYDNYFYLLNSIKGQSSKLNGYSTEDFCNLSEIMKSIRLPQRTTVYRAMQASDFGIGNITPEKFFEKYYKEGKIVTMPIYMESTFDKNVAYRFAGKKDENRFIIKLNVPKDTPAVYMERLTPGDGDVYGNEDELNIIKNSILKFGKLTKTTNPRNGEPIYEVDAEILGFRDIKPAPKQEFEMDNEMRELFEAMLKHSKE
ncbi:hypothetical protein IJ596_04040 [bacterium]|nr:hypothetical protein [bacterium]